MKLPGPVSDSVSSRFTPFALEWVVQSRAAAWTSANRESAQKPRSSLRYAGASARSQRYASYSSSPRAMSGSKTVVEIQ